MGINEINFHDACHNKKDCKQYETCPMKLVHKLISGKWKILILWYLCGGSLRFSDLKRKLPNVTQKMLTNQLRSLEEDGLIYRNVYPVFPPKVEYGLTDLGNNIIPMLKEMYKFGIMYSKNYNLIENKEKFIEVDM
ncbi:winged helix-turn-helix transcriptional regulator [Terrisporobacter sp.]|uniref:winged helix-turn-helix transcriptional regulator n=1 Tax=Terrisporobacter sp. TaxID=1965305 RepID=UPI00261D61EB|nr:helix-turn-helix domain-containing protein [Terrisporobacter sp.]